MQIISALLNTEIFKTTTNSLGTPQAAGDGTKLALV
jgi:hypothetical protein